MSYALKHLEAALEREYKNISSLEDYKTHFENELAETKDSLGMAYENSKELEQTIAKLKGETK